MYKFFIKETKRILGLFLAALLCVTILPAGVWAEEPAESASAEVSDTTDAADVVDAMDAGAEDRIVPSAGGAFGDDSMAEEAVNSSAAADPEAEENDVAADAASAQEDMPEEDVLHVLEYVDLFGEEWDPNGILQQYFDRELAAMRAEEEGLLTESGPELYSSDMMDARLSIAERAMYRELKAMASQVAVGQKIETICKISIQETFHKSFWTAEDLQVEQITVNGAMTEEAVEAITEVIDYNPSKVIKAALRDSPYEFFWAENYYLYGQGEKSYKVEVVDGREVVYFSMDTLQVQMPVSFHYEDRSATARTLIRNGKNQTYYTWVSASAISLPHQAAAHALQIVRSVEGESDMDKLRCYMDAICERNVYNTEAAMASGNYNNRDPWQLIYVFDEDPSTNVVCEGYAKAFQYLCELTVFDSDIRVYSVSGELWSQDRNLGGHMWNIVEMEDGGRYLVDLTNCDGATVNDWLFIASPSEGTSDTKYTFGSGASSLSYVYYDESRLLYTDEELTLSETPYGSENCPDGHAYEYLSTTKPTSLEKGFDTYVCANCGARQKRNFTDPLHASVNYYTHVQNYGNQKPVADGQVSGTYGKSLRLEGIWIDLDTNADLGVRYTTHVQDYGWLECSYDGNMSGTSGRSKRLEAIMIDLYGEDAESFDIYYRVHAQDYGWLGWTKNGAPAGTAGYSKRLEGIQIVVVPKGTFSPEYYANVQGAVYGGTQAYVSSGTVIPSMKESPSAKEDPTVNYRAHVQDYGWQNFVANGTLSGTSGKSKRLESIEIKVGDTSLQGDIEYCTHVQNIGWMGWVKNGSQSGTSGRSLRLEAIRIQLTGELYENYDVYYRVHAQNIGWLNWTSNGAESGTSGYGYRLEAIQIVLVKKGGPAPGNEGGIKSVTNQAFMEK